MRGKFRFNDDADGKPLPPWPAIMLIAAALSGAVAHAGHTTWAFWTALIIFGIPSAKTFGGDEDERWVQVFDGLTVSVGFGGLVALLAVGAAGKGEALGLGVIGLFAAVEALSLVRRLLRPADGEPRYVLVSLMGFAALAATGSWIYA